jgi:hypothetical protein
MQTAKIYSLAEESIDDMISAGRFNPAFVLTFRDKNNNCIYNLTIGHGTQDDTYLFEEDGIYYLLAVNTILGYIACEAIKDGQIMDSIFLDDNQDIEIFLGKKGINYAPITIAKRLRPHLNV